MLGRYRVLVKQYGWLLLLLGVYVVCKSAHAACGMGAGDINATNLALPSQITVPANAPDYTVLAEASTIRRFFCQPPPGMNSAVAETFTFSTYNMTSQPLGNNLYSTSVPGVVARLTFMGAALNGQSIGTIDPNATYYNVQTLYFSLKVELIKLGTIADKSVLSSVGSVGGFPVTGYAPFVFTYPVLTVNGTVGYSTGTFGTSFPIIFNVEQPKPVCRLTTPSLTVPLKSVSINTLNQTPAYQIVNAGRFNIGISCTANARAELTFADAYNLYNSLLQLNSTLSNQPINGVGLSIIPENNPYKNSNIVRDSLPIEFNGNLNQSVPFIVYYQRQPHDGPVMVPGEFKSIANFTLTYQ